MPETKQPFATLFELVRHRAATDANFVAYTFLRDGEADEENWTYTDLDMRARAIAARLQACCQPGDHVLLLFDPGLDYIAAFFACAYAGVIPVPAYPADPFRAKRTLPRLRAIASDCGATVALGHGEGVRLLGTGLAGELGLKLFLPTAEWQEWLHLPWNAPDPRPEDVALLQYTSGSTATPRGVLVTNSNLCYSVEQMRVADRDDTVGVSWLPMYHDLGLVGGILAPIWFNRRVILMSPLAFVQSPLRWLRAATRYRCTTTAAPNFAFDLCVNKFSRAEAEGLDLSRMRVLMTGAEPIRADTLERFTTTFAPYGLEPDVWYPCYGLAEATLGVTGTGSGFHLAVTDFSAAALERNQAVPVIGTAQPARRLVGCGWALDNTEVCLVDPVRRTLCPDGTVGEIWVRGPNVAQGYWGRPAETDAVFGAHLANHDRGPFLRTGDLGFLYQGQLHMTGRLKEMLIFRGRNIYPQDVERTAQGCHAGLRENGGAAFAVMVDGHERLTLVQELVRPGKVDLDALAGAIRAAVESEHAIPLDTLILIRGGTLPKTSSGKIQRGATRAQLVAGELEIVKQWQFAGEAPPMPAAICPDPGPRDAAAIRGWLVTRVSQFCNLPADAIDANAPLQSYALDSVSSVTIAMELQQWLGRTVEPTILYDNPSLAVLAARLADDGTDEKLSDTGLVDDLSQQDLDEALARLLNGSAGISDVPDGSKDLS